MSGKFTLPACESPWFARSGHAQTLFGYLIPSRRLPEGGRRQQVEIESGEMMTVRIHQPARIRETAPVVLLFHGLSGHVDSNYMRRTAHVALAKGCIVVRVNHRGAGEGMLLSKKSYHSGSAADASAILKWARGQWPEKSRLAIGFSLSGNVLLNLLGEQSGDEKPEGAIVVNPSIHLPHAMEKLSQGWNRLYDFNFSFFLLRMLRARHRAGLIESLPSWPRMCRVRDIDELYTAKAAGFRDREDYYQQCSSWNYVQRIDRPTLVLTAADDPFVDAEDFRTATWSSAVTLHIEPVGGHLGFLSKGRDPQTGRRWLDRALDKAIDYLESQTDASSGKNKELHF